MLAISSHRVNIWYHTDPHDQWKRVTWPVFFNGLGPSLGAKIVSTNGRPSTFSIIFRLFPSGGEKKIAPHLHEPAGGTPRHLCRFFRANNRRSDLPMFNIKQNLAQKLDPTLKLFHLEETPVLNFAHESPNVHAVFER